MSNAGMWFHEPSDNHRMPGTYTRLHQTGNSRAGKGKEGLDGPKHVASTAALLLVVSRLGFLHERNMSPE